MFVDGPLTVLRYGCLYHGLGLSVGQPVQPVDAQTRRLGRGLREAVPCLGDHLVNDLAGCVFGSGECIVTS
jgi:hypothetical protein